MGRLLGQQNKPFYLARGNLVMLDDLRFILACVSIEVVFGLSYTRGMDRYYEVLVPRA